MAAALKAKRRFTTFADCGFRKVTSNPAHSVTYRREDNNRVRFLTVEEERKLRKVIEIESASHIPELDLAINAGLRKGSQYGLTWDMVDWKGWMLSIPRTKNRYTSR